MTQTPPPSNGQVPNAGPPATGTPPGSGETPPAQLPQSIEDALKQVESLQAALKAANKESAGHRIKAKELDELKAKLEADKLSETEKLQKQIADLQAQHQEQVKAAQRQLVENEIFKRAPTLGIIDPDAAAKLIDWEDIVPDEKTGKPTNIDEVLKTLLKNKPYLAGKAQASSGGATNPSRSSSSRIGEITRDNLTEAMKPENFKDLSEAQKQQVFQMLVDRY